MHRLLLPMLAPFKSEVHRPNLLILALVSHGVVAYDYLYPVDEGPPPFLPQALCKSQTQLAALPVKSLSTHKISITDDPLLLRLMRLRHPLLEDKVRVKKG